MRRVARLGALGEHEHHAGRALCKRSRAQGLRAAVGVVSIAAQDCCPPQRVAMLVETLPVGETWRADEIIHAICDGAALLRPGGARKEGQLRPTSFEGTKM